MESEEPHQSLEEIANNESRSKPASPLVVNLYDYVDPLSSIVKEEHDLCSLEEDPMEISGDGGSTSQGQVVDVLAHENRDIFNQAAQEEVAAAVMSLLSASHPVVPPPQDRTSDDDERIATNGHEEECRSSEDESEQRYVSRLELERLEPLPEPQLVLPSSHTPLLHRRARNKLVANMPGQLQAFGRYVADELESMSAEQAIDAQAKIMTILLEANLEP